MTSLRLTDVYKTYTNFSAFISDLDSNQVILKNYESSPTGFIQSWIERFPNLDASRILVELWNKDKHYFVPINN